jgi:hypothetical protein
MEMNEEDMDGVGAGIVGAGVIGAGYSGGARHPKYSVKQWKKICSEKRKAAKAGRRRGAGKNPWIAYVKEFARANNMRYSDAMVAAKASYKKR